MQLSTREQDGSTLRDHLQRLHANTGRLDPRLDVAPVPDECADLWGAYLALAGQRRSGMDISALAITDIDAWARLSGVTLTGWELDTLLAIDGAALRVVADHRTAERARRAN